MRRLHTVLILTGIVVTLVTPAIAAAQPGERAATQLFLAPTGRVLPRGQAYFKSVEISVPFVQGGVTDRFSMGIGVSLLPQLPMVAISPKFQIQRSEKHSTSIGAVEFVATEGAFGMAYIAHTVELKTGALHVAALTPLTSWSDTASVAIMLGAEHRLSDRVMFMTENYFTAGSGPLLSAGFRLKAPHTTWDLGWLLPVGTYGTAGAPMINVGYKF